MDAQTRLAKCEWFLASDVIYMMFFSTIIITITSCAYKLQAQVKFICQIALF
jgi:hypothetical protein